MAADVLSISNRALLSVGARTQVSSVFPSDGSAEANSLSVLWNPTFEQLARVAPWNSLRKSAQLALLAAAQGTPENPEGTTYPLPEFPWLYSYAYPADCLRFSYIIPSNPVGQGGSPPQTTINNTSGPIVPSGGQIRFVVSSALDANGNPIKIILTNQDQAQGVYVSDIPNPAQWDSLFQGAMVATLGAFLVPALSLSFPLMQIVIKQAEEAIQIARVADGNEGVTSMDHLPDWMQARAGAQGIGGGYGFWNNGFLNFGGGYDGICWPNGTYE